MPIVTTMIAALMGAAIFEFLRVPAGALIGAAVGVALANLSPVATTSLPSSMQFVSFAGIGWLIGQGITLPLLKMLWANAWFVGIVVLGLLAFSGVLALIGVHYGSLDIATSFLASSPGGVSQMSALGASVGANGALVATVHTVRAVTLLILAPIIVRFLPGAGG